MEFIRNNLLLVAIAFVSGAMLLWPLVRRGGGGGASVDTLAATRLMNSSDALMIDVREPDEYRAGHILGARSAPLAQLDKGAGELARFKERELIVYCADGRRSGTALDALRKAGFSKVHSLAGGFSAWRQAGLPVEK